MKLTTRGFTLVELMIVIAIIGILAAALFPSMTGYLKRSRDAARTSHLKDITTALGAFYSDSERYPTKSGSSTANCIAEPTFLLTNYFPKGFPSDPQSSTRPAGINGCVGSTQYGYSTGNIAGAAGFQVGTSFENANGGNTGTYITSALGATNYAADLGVSKGAGSGYILGN